jgi:RNA polymerase sigma-70 factor (ECF subfamily)
MSEAIAVTHETAQLDGATRVFLRTRPRLFGIAYRILRSPFEAEDIVQDAWVRWQGADRAGVVNAEAFLATTTARLALNHLQSARRRRETPAGAQLPEAPESDVGPERVAERSDDVELAVLMLLAKLAPAERATYVLREAFDYPYDRIADLLRLSSANCRQLVRRARKRMAAGRCRPVSSTAHRRLLAAFLSAAQDGKVAALESLLAADVRPVYPSTTHAQRRSVQR